MEKKKSECSSRVMNKVKRGRERGRWGPGLVGLTGLDREVSRGSYMGEQHRAHPGNMQRPDDKGTRPRTEQLGGSCR